MGNAPLGGRIKGHVSCVSVVYYMKLAVNETKPKEMAPSTQNSNWPVSYFLPRDNGILNTVTHDHSHEPLFIGNFRIPWIRS